VRSAYSDVCDGRDLAELLEEEEMTDTRDPMKTTTKELSCHGWCRAGSPAVPSWPSGNRAACRWREKEEGKK